MSDPFKIFIAYSRKDSSYLEELRTHFTPLERTGQIMIWYDGKIEPGVVWEAAIKENLHSADIILLLVSADAIASDYFYEKEMSHALERHAAGNARVVPLILRSCAWQATPLGQLQALPKDGQPVTTWSSHDDAYANAVNSLLEMLKNLQAQRIEAARKAEMERLRLLEEQSKPAETVVEPKSREPKKTPTTKPPKVGGQRPPTVPSTAPPPQRVEAAVWQKYLRSPWVWGGALAIMGFFLLKNLLADTNDNVGLQPADPNSGYLAVYGDTTDQGAKTLRPEDLPENVGTEVPDTTKTKQKTYPVIGIKKQLKCGNEINLMVNSGESKLLAFLDDGSRKVDKATWFTLERVVFDLGKANLDMEISGNQLKALAEILKCYDHVRVKIGVHTDNRGNASANQKLTDERAKTLKATLVALGVEPSRIEATGFGGQNPIASNDTEEGRSQNRRVALLVMEK